MSKKISTLITQNTKQTYQYRIFGTWGTFETPAGRFQYLLTKARLGINDAAPASQLTKLPAPAREVLDVAEMDFNQLLQRDLDDHRTANDLVPYVLQPDLTGPEFFPPIVAVVLPFEHGKRAADAFPKAVLQNAENDTEYCGGFRSEAYGSGFKFQILLQEDVNMFDNGSGPQECVKRIRVGGRDL